MLINPHVRNARLADHLGAKLSVWCDDPNAKSEAQVAVAIKERLRVLAQQTWGSPKPLLYWHFLGVMKAVGPAPA